MYRRSSALSHLLCLASLLARLPGFLPGEACLGAEPIITTAAGTGSATNNGDAGLATATNIGEPFGVQRGPDQAIYITEVRHHRIRRLDPGTGQLTTVAGSGTQGYSGDGGVATKAALNEPYEVRFDRPGNMYLVEMQNNIVRRVEASTNIISTIAGNGQAGFGGDGGPATQARLRQPHSIALDHRGGLYIADIGNHRIRRVDLASGMIDTVAGNGEAELPTDGGQARGHALLGPRALAIDGPTMWIALREGHSVWQLDLNEGTLHHVAGSGMKGNRDGDRLTAQFNGPKGIAVGPDGRLFVVDTENHTIRAVDPQRGLVTTVAGSGQPGDSGDGGPARKATMNRPHGIGVDANGDLYIGDTLNHRVRRVTLGE